MVQVCNEEDWGCPQCGAMMNINIDIGDSYLYDSCGGLSGCGFKRKRKKRESNDQAESKVQESI